MRERKPLVGKKFGRWTVLAEAESARTPNGWVKRMVIARCECGTTKAVRASSIYARSSSCGCLQRNPDTLVHTPEYTCWQNMKDRCLNPRNPAYHNYGGRGIGIAEQWVSDFAQFLADVGERPDSKLSLDRIDNDGNYEPGNVRWATAQMQANNRRKAVRSA